MLDVRNDYEWDAGHFQGAERPAEEVGGPAEAVEMDGGFEAWWGRVACKRTGARAQGRTGKRANGGTPPP